MHWLLQQKQNKSKMFQNILSNPGLNHISEQILVQLDIQSLWRCRLVCKSLLEFIKQLEQSQRLKDIDLKTIKQIRYKKFLVHKYWKPMFNAICTEDNFYKRRSLVYFLMQYFYEKPFKSDLYDRIASPIEMSFVASG